MAAYRRTHGPSRLAWSEGWQPTGAELHSSDEPSELSKWLCHDDSTINIDLSIIIIIINSWLELIEIVCLLMKLGHLNVSKFVSAGTSHKSVLLSSRSKSWTWGPSRTKVKVSTLVWTQKVLELSGLLHQWSVVHLFAFLVQITCLFVMFVPL